ncbi:MAG: hypothetical protein C5S46_01120, partial [Candidatus Methanomarinus sp.]
AAHIRENITYAARFIGTNKLVSGQTLLEPLLRSVIAPFFLIFSSSSMGPKLLTYVLIPETSSGLNLVRME